MIELMNKIAEEVIAQMKHNLLMAMRNRANEVGGQVPPFSSILQQEFDVDITGNLIIIKMPYYTPFINEGVKGNESTYTESQNSPYQFRDKTPPFYVFAGAKGWISQRGLIDRAKYRKLAGGNKEKLKELVINANIRLSFAIAKSIQKKGIKGYHFIEKTFESKNIDRLLSKLLDKQGVEQYLIKLETI